MRAPVRPIVKRGHLLGGLVAPFLAACGALIGAEWDGTLRVAEIDGAPAGEDADTDGGEGGRDAATAPDAAAAPDAAQPGTCGGDSKFCLCKAHQPEDGGVTCSTRSVSAGGFCCASKNWPITGTCLCSEFKCDRSAVDFCECAPFGKGTLSSCSGALCCYSPSIAQCSCYDTGAQSCPAISGDETPVASCTLQAVPCGTNEKRTDDCGIVTP
jgi:hypothetical protein